MDGVDILQVLVSGAAGWIGHFVVNQLRLAGVDVVVSGVTPGMVERLFPASSGATPIRVLEDQHFDDAKMMRQTLRSLDGILATPDAATEDPLRQKRLIRLASDLGLTHFVSISSCDDERYQTTFGNGSNLAADLKVSGLPFTILKPSLMDSVMVEHASEIRDEGIWIGSAPQGRNAFIDPRDVVAAAAAVLLQARPKGDLYLPGPEQLSYTEVAAVLSHVLQRDIHYQVVGPHEHLQALQAQGLSPSQAQRRLARDAATEHQGAPALNDEVLHLTGRPPGTLADYLEDHRRIFATAD